MKQVQGQALFDDIFNKNTVIPIYEKNLHFQV